MYSYGKANPLKFTDPTGTTVTVQPSTVTDSNSNASISTTQSQANQAFLRDIRAGLADNEASLFQIDKSNRLVFSGDQKKLSEYSEYTQMLVGQINSEKKIVKRWRCCSFNPRARGAIDCRPERKLFRTNAGQHHKRFGAKDKYWRYGFFDTGFYRH